MAQVGALVQSLRGDGPWRGMSLLSKAEPGTFELLENCYVNSDGSQIRSFPGWLCVIDPETNKQVATNPSNVVNTPDGYEALTIDARLPSQITVGGFPYTRHAQQADVVRQQYIWTRPTTIHAVEQVRGFWQFYGESDFRREPVFNTARTQFVYVTDYQSSDAGTTITLTLSANPDTTGPLNRVSLYDRIWLDGMVGPLANLLNNRSHKVIAIASNTVKISTNPGGTVSLTSSPGFIARVTPGVQSGSASPIEDSDIISDDAESLTVWTCLSRGRSDTIENRVFASHVANRMRDFGESAAGIEGNSALTSAYYGRSRRRQARLPYRLVPHVAGNRTILVAPGYGCVFQAPMTMTVDYLEQSSGAGLKWIGNDVYDRPRCLGVPKAIAAEDLDKSIATSAHFYTATLPSYAWGGTSYSGRAGRYKFKFAYRDDVTGEVGLCSEPVEVSTLGDTVRAATGIRLYVHFPGYRMSECLALSVNVYRTVKNGDTYYFDRSIPLRTLTTTPGSPDPESVKYGLFPSSNPAASFKVAQYNAIWQSDEALKRNTGYVPEVLEQMPMGCKTARTIRGWTFFGGALGNAGTYRQYLQGEATFQYDGVSGIPGICPRHNELTFRCSPTEYGGPSLLVPPEGIDGKFGCADRWIPPAYSGQAVWSNELFPYPRYRVVLNKAINTTVAVYGLPSDGIARFGDVRFEVLDSPLRSTDYYFGSQTRAKQVILELPRGRYQISEPDNPGVTPATNTTILANEQDEDIEGMAVVQGGLLSMTRTKTYLTMFATTPVGANAEVVSDRFGCISANSCTQSEGAAFWLSDLGPVMFAGGIQWIGEPLEKLFRPETGYYLRDSLGMMRHSWACHDPERGVVYFGLFANRARGTSLEHTVTMERRTLTWEQTQNYANGDEYRSRFPCDEVLIYSIKAGAWSVWRPPLGFGIQWMTVGMNEAGQKRVHFLGSDRRLYVLEDAACQFSWDANFTTVTQTGLVTTINVISTGIKMRPGMTALFYTVQDGRQVAVGERTIASTTATTVTLDSPIQLAGPFTYMLVGVNRMRIKTNAISPKGEMPSKVVAIRTKHMLHDRYTASSGVTGTPGFSLADMSAAATIRSGQVLTPVTGKFTESAESPYSLVGQSEAQDRVQDAAFVLGAVDGQNHQIDVRMFGPSQVRLCDLAVEVR